MSVGTFPPSQMSTRTKILAVVGLAAAVWFIYGQYADIYWLRMVTKSIPVLCMALAIVFQPDKERYQWLVILGLLFCMGGNMLLEPTTSLSFFSQFFSR